MLDLVALREQAARSGLTETSHNEESMLVCFQSSTDGRTIKVYYRSGTVGVFLFGGEQLWRRRQPLDKVRLILSGSIKTAKKSYYTRVRASGIEHGETGSQQQLYEFLRDGVNTQKWTAIRKLAKTLSQEFEGGHVFFRFKSVSQLVECYPDLIQTRTKRIEAEEDHPSRTFLEIRAAQVVVELSLPMPMEFGALAPSSSSQPSGSTHALRRHGDPASSSSSSSSSLPAEEPLAPFSEKHAEMLFKTDLAQCEAYAQLYLTSEDCSEFCKCRIFLADIRTKLRTSASSSSSSRRRRDVDAELSLVEQALEYLRQARLWSDEKQALDLQASTSMVIERHPLQPISEAINLSIDGLVDYIGKIQAIVEAEIVHLERRLNPQLRDRDEAKQRYGEQRWKENPSPKNDYAERRRADEELLAKRKKQLAKLALFRKSALELRR